MISFTSCKRCESLLEGGLDALPVKLIVQLSGLVSYAKADIAEDDIYENTDSIT